MQLNKDESKNSKKALNVLMVLILFSFLSCNHPKREHVHDIEINEAKYTTWSDLCFDRAASMWLIKNLVDSTATFSFQKFGTRITEGIPFDVPGAELGRQRNISCFESIIKKYEIEDPAIVDMAKIIHDIDVNKWGVKLTNEADSLENLFMEIRRHADSDHDVINQANEIFNTMYKNY